MPQKASKRQGNCLLTEHSRNILKFIFKTEQKASSHRITINIFNLASSCILVFGFVCFGLLFETRSLSYCLCLPSASFIGLYHPDWLMGICMFLNVYLVSYFFTRYIVIIMFQIYYFVDVLML